MLVSFPKWQSFPNFKNIVSFIFVIMYLVPKCSYLDFCASVKLIKFWDFAAAMGFPASMDNVPDVWF